MKKKETLSENNESRTARSAELTEDEAARVTGGSGLLPDDIPEGALAQEAGIVLPKEKTTEEKSGQGTGTAGGGAGIPVPEESRLIIIGKGTLKA